MCAIQKVPFRGAPCSDAAGRQIPYSTMMKQINSSMSGRIWDKEQRAPYYNYKVRTLKYVLMIIGLFIIQYQLLENYV